MISSKVCWQLVRKSPTENNKQQQPIKILKRSLINRNQNQVELKTEQNRLHLYRLLRTLVSLKKLIHS